MVKVEERDDVTITSRGWWGVAERIVKGTLALSIVLAAMTVLNRDQHDAQLVLALYAFAVAIPVQGGALVMLSFLGALVGTSHINRGTVSLVMIVAYFGALLALFGTVAVFWHYSQWVALIFAGVTVVVGGLTFSTLQSV